MLGDTVMVAPVITKGASSVAIYLPGGSGNWTHVWTGQNATGPRWLTVPTPMGAPAVFLRAESPWALTLRRALCNAASVCT